VAATDDRAARAARLAGLYAVTPDLDDTAALVAKCAAAIDGGAEERRDEADPNAHQQGARKEPAPPLVTAAQATDQRSGFG